MQPIKVGIVIIFIWCLWCGTHPQLPLSLSTFSNGFIDFIGYQHYWGSSTAFYLPSLYYPDLASWEPASLGLQQISGGFQTKQLISSTLGIISSNEYRFGRIMNEEALFFFLSQIVGEDPTRTTRPFSMELVYRAEDTTTENDGVPVRVTPPQCRHQEIFLSCSKTDSSVPLMLWVTPYYNKPSHSHICFSPVVLKLRKRCLFTYRSSLGNGQTRGSQGCREGFQETRRNMRKSKIEKMKFEKNNQRWKIGI